MIAAIIKPMSTKMEIRIAAWIKIKVNVAKETINVKGYNQRDL